MVIAKSKKVESHMNTVKSMDHNWAPGQDPPNSQDGAVPRAIFIPHPQSLPFEERRVTLDQPVKIGRNVYKATPPCPNNAIFECRVLSRHHATLYYESGHFYLVMPFSKNFFENGIRKEAENLEDHQSSNGTFINNNRVAISKEPHEVFSGTVVKFGISVVENVPDSGMKTCPPVIAQLKLFHADGKEASIKDYMTMTTQLQLKDMYQLKDFIQEAIRREASLENRLHTLRECVERTREAAKASWELFIGEQRLLMRVLTLENMLSTGKNPELKQCSQLLDDKRNYQEVAQHSLRVAHEQRLALEETLEKRSREAAALHQQNCALRLAANNALTDLQKLASSCERKLHAAKYAIAAAEKREAAVRKLLPLTYSVQNNEAKMLVLSSDNERNVDCKGTLEEAIRTLPDYVKLLLPSIILNKVGIKVVSSEGKTAKEFDQILRKNKIFDNDAILDSESNEKGESEQSNSNEICEEKEDCETTLDLCTDDEKQSRLNHDTTIEAQPLPTEGELVADNNANSTFTDTVNKDETSNNDGVEYANILCIMAGLNDEIKALRDRLKVANTENKSLRSLRDELLATQAEQKVVSFSVEPEDAASYRAKIADLQAKLTRSNVAEESNLAEIQRLATSAASMEAELALRPHNSDIDDLSAVIGHLQNELSSKNQIIDQLRNVTPPRTEDKQTETDIVAEPETETIDTEIDVGKVSAEIDDLFKLDYDEDEDSNDSMMTEVATETSVQQLDQSLDEELRITRSMANGAMHALEEELVRAKERWAIADEERARLAATLLSMENKRSISLKHLTAIAIPLIALALAYFLLPYIS